jgi:hypothetical protein
MLSNTEPITSYASWELEQAAARLGLTPAEVELLLDSELDLDQLLNYVTAVVSDRMN